MVPRELLGSSTLVENPNVGRNIDGRPGPLVLTGVFPDPVHNGAYVDGGFYVVHDTRQDRMMERFQLRWENVVLGDPNRVAINALAPEFGREHKDFMREICNPEVRSPAKDLLTSREEFSFAWFGLHKFTDRRTKEAPGPTMPHHPSLVPLFQEAREVGRELLRKMGATEILETRAPFGTSFNSNTGSCRAGSDPRTSVVNPYFESHDVENLLICDASVTPMGATPWLRSPHGNRGLFRLSKNHRASFQPVKQGLKLPPDHAITPDYRFRVDPGVIPPELSRYS